MVKEIDFVRLHLAPLAQSVQENAIAWVTSLGQWFMMTINIEVYIILFVSNRCGGGNTTIATTLTAVFWITNPLTLYNYFR